MYRAGILGDDWVREDGEQRFWAAEWHCRNDNIREARDNDDSNTATETKVTGRAQLLRLMRLDETDRDNKNRIATIDEIWETVTQSHQRQQRHHYIVRRRDRQTHTITLITNRDPRKLQVQTDDEPTSVLSTDTAHCRHQTKNLLTSTT